eukprot:PhF_6_TR42629/c1_g2_i1/m.64102
MSELDGVCVHCFKTMRRTLGQMSDQGPVHNDCVEDYNRTKIERCAHCDCKLREQRTLLNGKKLHPECVVDFKAGVKFVPQLVFGQLKKFSIGRSLLGSKNWQTRYFAPEVDKGLYYYKTKEDAEAGRKDKYIPIYQAGCRLVTHPTKGLHPEATNPSKEFVIIWNEGGGEKELMALLQASTWQEHDSWCKFLECVIKIVDAPADTKK